MKILLLTPIDPISSADLYIDLSKTYENKNINFLCFPFFAEMRSNMKNQNYVVTLLAMLKTSIEPVMHKKLYDNKKTLVIGNTLKDEKFDMIIAFNEKTEDEIYDTYLEALKTNEEFEDLRYRFDFDNLYGIEDAEIVLPTRKHVKLFLEGVYK